MLLIIGVAAGIGGLVIFTLLTRSPIISSSCIQMHGTYGPFNMTALRRGPFEWSDCNGHRRCRRSRFAVPNVKFVAEAYLPSADTQGAKKRSIIWTMSMQAATFELRRR
jgi:hypothetical protein